MEDKFSIGEWKYNRLIKEGKDLIRIDTEALGSIYDFLTERLDGPAKKAGLRMSIFEQEYPNKSSFIIGYDNVSRTGNTDGLHENINNNIDKIVITHDEKRGRLYRIKVLVDGKEQEISREELNDLISSTIGQQVKIPETFDQREFKPIEDKLLAKDIEVDYNDFMDVS